MDILFMTSYYANYASLQNRVRGITRSVSARRWEDDGFDVRSKAHHS